MTPSATGRAPRAESTTTADAVESRADGIRLVHVAEAKPATLWRHGRFQADAWTLVGDEEAVSEGPAILPLKRFLAERETLTARNAPLGVAVSPEEPIEDLAPYLDRVALVSLPFPKFADGRSMSKARLLRERYGFEGEVRATGEVLIDQMPLMRRCGFDAFVVDAPVTRAQLAAGKWPELTLYMQPVGSIEGEVPAGSRPWARRAAMLQAAE